MTVVLTTHHMDEAERLADQIHIIDHGRMIASGTPRELTRGGTSTIRLVVTKPFPEGAPDSLQQALGNQLEVTTISDMSLLITGPADSTTLATVSMWCERQRRPPGVAAPRPAQPRGRLPRADRTGAGHVSDLDRSTQRRVHPRPGAAPLRRQVLAQAAIESKLMLRNGEQLLLAVVIPVIVLVGGVEAAQHIDLGLSQRPIDEFVPGVLALAVMSTAFTSLAIATGFERRYGVIKRLGSSPLPRSGLLLGKVGALLAVEALQILVISLVAFAMDWQPQTSLPAAILMVLAGTAAFAALGLFVAGVLRAEATLAAANLVYLLLLVGGAVVLPASAYGGFGGVTELLPSGALGEGLRSAFWYGELRLGSPCWCSWCGPASAPC